MHSHRDGFEPGRPARRLRVVLVGWGAIAQATAELVDHEAIELVAVAVQDRSAPRVGLPPSTRVIDDPTRLGSFDVDVVAEAAGRSSVEPWGRAALAGGAHYIVSSASAFTDTALLADLRQLAVEQGVQLHLHPGAVGGIDALAAARPYGLDGVEHRIIKPPEAWRGTPAESEIDLDGLVEPQEFFSGSAALVAERYPKNANVAMTVALAGVGPDATRVALVADPSATHNRHHVSAHGGFGRLDLTISNRPLAANPKSSAMAALGLARAIGNRAAAVSI